MWVIMCPAQGVPKVDAVKDKNSHTLTLDHCIESVVAVYSPATSGGATLSQSGLAGTMNRPLAHLNV